MKHHEHGLNGTCPHCQAEPLVRNNYGEGMMMTARKFFTDQHYGMKRAANHNQRAHGSGTLCGLEVKQHPSQECQSRYLIITPGSAIDCCGRDIIVVEEEILDFTSFDAVAALSRNPDDKDHRLQVCLRYQECPTELVPVLYDDCGCDETQCIPDRILESFQLDVLVDQPLPVHEPNTPLLKRFVTANLAHASRVALRAASANSARLYVLAADNGKTVFELETESYSVVRTHTLTAPGLELAVSPDGARLYVAIENPSGAAGDPRQLVVVNTEDEDMSAIRTINIPGSAGSALYMAALSNGNALMAMAGTSGDLHVWPASVNNPGPDPAPDTRNLGANMSSMVLSSNGQYAYVADAANNQVVAHDINAKTNRNIKVTPNGVQPSFVGVASSSGPDLLVVTSFADKMLYLVEPAAPSLIGSAPLDHPPVAAAVSPGGAWAYVLEDDGTQSYVQIVSLRRLQENLPPRVSTPVLAGPASRQIVVSLSGKRIYVPYEDDLTLLGRGGVAVFEVDEQRCLDLLYRPCPDCEHDDCLILATVENYRPGFRVVDMGDPPIDPRADRAAGVARIDNRLGRKTVPSVQALAEAVECLLEHEGDGPGTQGPPGNPGPGIDNVTINWVPCGQEPQPPQIVSNPDGTRTLVMEIPNGCQDLVVVNETADCGEAGSAKIETINGVPTLTISFPPRLTDLEVQILNDCQRPPSGKVLRDRAGNCKLVLNIPRDCEQPPAAGSSTTGEITLTAEAQGQITTSPPIKHCLGNNPVGLMLAEDTGECDRFEALNFIGPQTSLFLLDACVPRSYDGTFSIRIAQDPAIADRRDYRIRWVAVAGPKCDSSQPPNVNNATHASLVAVPGISTATADRIVEEREKRPFTDLDDFRHRIKPSARAWKLMKDEIFVSKPTDESGESGNEVSDVEPS